MFSLIVAGVVFAIVYTHANSRKERGENLSPAGTAFSLALISFIIHLVSSFFTGRSYYGYGYDYSFNFTPYILTAIPTALYFFLYAIKPKKNDSAAEIKSKPQYTLTLSDLERRVSILEAKLNNREIPVMHETTPEPALMQEPIPSPEKIWPIESAPITPKPEETQMTGKWFGIIGIAAVVIGVGLFIKFAFDHNLITPVGKIMLGIFAGALLLFLGGYLRKKYREFADFLSSGGLILLYISIFGAFSYYHLIGQVPALLFMSAISILGVGLALKYDSQMFAGLAHAGAFLTPFMLYNGENQQIALFTYVLLINIGFWILSIQKKWHSLYFINVIGTWLSVFAWMAAFYTPAEKFNTIGWMAAFYILLLMGPYIASISKKIAFNAESIGITLVNSGIFFLASYGLLHDDGQNTVLFAVGAVVLAALGLLIRQMNPDDKIGRLGLFSMALVLVTAIFPIQLTDKPTVVIWTAEALLLCVLGLALKQYAMRIYALILFAISGFLLLTTMAEHGGPSGQIFFNPQVLTQVWYVVALFAAAYLIRKWKSSLRPEEASVPIILRIPAHALLIYTLSSELLRYFRMMPGDHSDVSNFSLSLLWAFYASVTIMVGIWRHLRAERMMATFLFGIVIIKVFLYDSANLDELYRIFSFISLGVILLVVSFLFYKFKDRIKQFLIEE